MTVTPWLYDTVTVTTYEAPVRWDVVMFPMPGDDLPDEPDPEDDWTEE